MQVSKAGVAAAGALATVAVMGSAAAAAPAAVAPTDASKSATTVLGVGNALQDKAAPAARVDSAPFQSLITIGVGTSLTAAPWQVCGSTAVGGVGGTAAVGSPHTVIGNCHNSNAWLQQDNVQGLISILDDSAVNVLPWQVCGSNVVGGVGLGIAADSPATVTGNCHNADTLIEAPDTPGPASLISVLSGSVLNAVPWQVCGSSAVMGVGAVVASSSPTTVVGDCTSAGILIEPRPNQAALPILSGIPLNILPLQQCEQNSPVSLVGLVIPLNSPAFVGGTCYVPDGLPADLDLMANKP